MFSTLLWFESTHDGLNARSAATSRWAEGRERNEDALRETRLCHRRVTFWSYRGKRLVIAPETFRGFSGPYNMFTGDVA